jgi:hypothetical protein
MSSRNILRRYNADIYIDIARSERIFSNAGKESISEYISHAILILILRDHSVLKSIKSIFPLLMYHDLKNRN